MKRILTSLMAILMIAISAQAYDFQSGDLFYKITGSATVEVTYDVYNNSLNYSNLTSATIPASVTNGETTYSVTSIGNNAFSWSTKLASITIPHNIKSIGNYAFYNCSALISVSISDSVTVIGEYAFSGCDKLTTITIPSGTTSIEDGTFMYCSSLDSVNIPNGVTSIGSAAFYSCSSLDSIYLPNSVASIESEAFKSCNNLQIVYCDALTPPNASSGTFTNYNATLYVPCSSKSSYASHATWGQFQHIRCPGEETDIESLESESAEQNTRKILRDGQVIILRDGEEYTILGQKL